MGEEVEGFDQPAPSSSRRVRPLSLIVTAVLLVVTVGVTLVTRQAVRGQERRLLQERASEVNLVLQVAVSGVQGNLAQLGTALRLTDSSPTAFREASAPLVTPATSVRGMTLLRPSGDGFVVVAAVGPAFDVGQILTGPRAAAARQALDQHNSFTTPVFSEGNTRVSGLAAGPPVAPDGTVLYRETIVQPPGSAAVSRSAPFSELYVVLYDGASPDPTQIGLATGNRIPRHGTVRQQFKVGASNWLLLVSAQHPLVGSLARMAPWLVLGAGLLLTVLVAMLIENVLRRRDYAMALVDERTAALRSSLEALRQAQQTLVRQERLVAVGQLASAVGHELRNPLTAISNAIYLVRGLSASTSDERITRHLNTAEREVSAASLIISDLLDFARARPPALASVDLNSVIDESLEVAPPPEGIEIVWQPAPDVPPVAADRDQLRRVILNLITNGYDAMPVGGALRLATAINNGMVEATVADTGTGVEPAAREHLFEPFFTTKAQGVGLGLAITDQIVTAHRGKISVDSQAGEGATFVVALPAFRAAEPQR